MNFYISSCKELGQHVFHSLMFKWHYNIRRWKLYLKKEKNVFKVWNHSYKGYTLLFTIISVWVIRYLSNGTFIMFDKFLNWIRRINLSLRLKSIVDYVLQEIEWKRNRYQNEIQSGRKIWFLKNILKLR